MSKAVVHIIDDDESMRRALARLLGTMGIESRCYGSAGEFLMCERPSGPGCIILDIRMPGPSGLELNEVLARADNPLPVIFLTGYADVPTSVRALKSGAVDFLTKPVDRREFLAAVDAALTREKQQRAVHEERRFLWERYEKLTRREREVFAQVAQGRLNKQIASALGTSERTVKAHRAQVMEKMGIRSVPELVRAADKLTARQLARSAREQAREIGMGEVGNRPMPMR